jgi:methyltransferase family protein
MALLGEAAERLRILCASKALAVSMKLFSWTGERPKLLKKRPEPRGEVLLFDRWIGTSDADKMDISLRELYRELCNTPSDIQAFLPNLSAYAQQCETIVESGMRGGTSTVAFLVGLLDNGKAVKRYIGCDLVRNKYVDALQTAARKSGIDFTFLHGSDLEQTFPQCDLLFIDTWHVYGQLKRELEMFHHLTRRIILHDTTVDELIGETVRLKTNIIGQMGSTGWQMGEIVVGLWPAVTEFLVAHPEWEIEARYAHCNGLTILRRRDDQGTGHN